MVWDPKQFRDDPALYAGTAFYYARYRFPYPQELFKILVQTFKLDGGGRALDLGCGPGQLTIPLAHSFEQIIGVDPDADMLAEARRAADLALARNVEFVQGSSWALPPTLRQLRLATMGQSFHWMDREQVLRELYDRLSYQGGVAIVTQDWHAPPEYQKAEDETVKKFLGERRRAGQGYYDHPDERHDIVLSRSPLKVLEPWTYSYERELTIDSAVGYLYSTSYASRHQLGSQVAEFETEFRHRLLQAEPTGTFKLRVEVTALLAEKT